MIIKLEKGLKKQVRNVARIKNGFVELVVILLLRPVTLKCPQEIACHLLDISSIFAVPSILQSDNGREFVNSVITELSAMWDGLKIVHGKPRHSQSQGSVERANRDIEDMLMTWLQSNSTTHWGDGLRFIQVMKNRAYHEGIKCSPYEAMFGQPMKVGLKTSNLPDDAIDDIFAKEELEKIISGQDGDEQNDLTDKPTAGKMIHLILLMLKVQYCNSTKKHPQK